MEDNITITDTTMKELDDISIKNPHWLKHRLVPFIITFPDTNLTSIDIQILIEAGLTIVNFKLWKDPGEMLSLMVKLQKGLKLNCLKYNISDWPIALCVNIPNACIKTGNLEQHQDAPTLKKVLIESNSIIEITCNKKYLDKCTSKRIYIDDPYTFTGIKIGTEMSVAFGRIIMVCIEIVDAVTIKSEVLRGDYLTEQEVFCIRGVKHTKPPLSTTDLHLIEFAKKNKIDFIAINSLRRPENLLKIKNMLKDARHPPLVLASICEQEGLDNIDEIIKLADGIIFAREFLAHEIVEMSKMITIEMKICAKCRLAGKPILLSGNILESTLQTGSITERDIADISNAVGYSTGFILRDYTSTKNVISAMHVMNNICQTVGTLRLESDFWRFIDECKIPANAAEACILSCALTMKVTNTKVCVVLTVTGKTAKSLSYLLPGIIILTIVTDPAVARELWMYRGIVPIIYSEKPQSRWLNEMNGRLTFAIDFAIKYDMLRYGDTYVTLKRSNLYSSFCDQLSILHVTRQTTALECPE